MKRPSFKPSAMPTVHELAKDVQRIANKLAGRKIDYWQAHSICEDVISVYKGVSKPGYFSMKTFEPIIKLRTEYRGGNNIDDKYYILRALHVKFRYHWFPYSKIRKQMKQICEATIL